MEWLLNHNNLWSIDKRNVVTCGAEQIRFVKADLKTQIPSIHFVLASTIFDQISKINN